MNTSSTPSPFWNIWQDHREHLLGRSLRLMGGNLADAEDALNAAMLRAFQRFPSSAGELLNERAWLSRILRNVCMDLHRERRRFVEPALEQGEMEVTIPGREEPPPEAQLLARERAEKIRERIHALPPNLRAPFEMRFLQDMSYADIAEQLRLTNCNVRKRIQLAYEILRVTLGDARPGR